MNKGRIFASGDWHGCGKVAKQVLDYLGPNDTLYFLGDAIDRGRDGLAIFDELIADPRVIFIKGNHEAMMADAIPSIVKDLEERECFDPCAFGYRLWFQNGGEETAYKFLNMDKTRIYKYRELINNMPTEVRYSSPAGHTVIMEHAGYTPFDIPHRSHDPLWDRDHFYDKWGAFMGGKWEKNSEVDKTYLVHGHTPVQYLRLMYGYDGMEPLTKEERKHKNNWWNSRGLIIPEIIRYCSGHKFDIDCCTIVSRRIALLDLDTFETIYFDEEEN